jgi:adenylate kinase
MQEKTSLSMRDEASEDKLLDEMEPLMAEGGYIVEFHSVDFFPERWFDLVLVLRTNNTVLYDRLVSRGYSQKKIEENISAEIMCVVLEEARESYDEAIVHELDSNTLADLQSSVGRVTAWQEAWKADHGVPAGSGGSA